MFSVLQAVAHRRFGQAARSMVPTLSSGQWRLHDLRKPTSILQELRLQLARRAGSRRPLVPAEIQNGRANRGGPRRQIRRLCGCPCRPRRAQRMARRALLLRTSAYERQQSNPGQGVLWQPDMDGTSRWRCRTETRLIQTMRGMPRRSRDCESLNAVLGLRGKR
jgi:hypothetical protein